MDAKNKLLLIMLFTSLLGLLSQTPLMQAVSGGNHRFINGNNVDCLSCHGNYPNAAHQVGLPGHQSAAENRNYTTYLEIGGTSYDPAGIIYTNIDSDFSGANDVWTWSGFMWIYGNQARLYDLDFNNDGSINGSETCKLCHNKELMRTSVEKSPEHTFGKRSCNDGRCHGNSNEDYRFFKTGYNTIPPASISNPDIITGNFYINNTWTNPSDNDYNYTIFKYSNGSILTTVNSSINYLNNTVSPHYVQNLSAVTVDIYNNINQTEIWFNITLPNNLPLIGQIGNRNVIAGNIIQFNIMAIDTDNDNLTYSTNATNGTFDTVSGNYTWQTNSNDSGEHVLYFNAMDNYGGIATEKVLIMVSSPSVYIPPIPANLSAIQGNFWINYTWEPGTGNITDSYNLSLNGNWSNGTSLTYHNDTVGPHGWSNITVLAYNNSGGMNSVSQETQVLNNQPVLSPIGNWNAMQGSLLQINITAIDADNDTLIYGTNASKGVLNQSTGEYSWSTNSSDVGTYTFYFNSSDSYGGNDTETIYVTINAQPIPYYIPAVPVNLSSTKGNFWINHSWLPGLTNITDSYNVSVNDLWTNGTIITYNNSTVTPHGWSNITVYAYNTSGTGSLNITPAYENIQLANNAPVQSPTSDKIVTAGSLLSFNITSTDADIDPITYGTNASKGLLNTTTGEYTWQTTGSDAGTYTWYFNSSDPFQGTDNATITITVTLFIPETYIPPVPVNLSSMQGNFWINHSWLPGLTNITDSYNVSVNDLWTNGTIITYNNSTVTPHGWSNITVYAYNNSGSGSLSPTSVSENIQLANNAPILSLPSDKIVTAGSLLSFNITSTDADSDPITYGTNASRGTLNTTTGEYTWQTTGSDAGTYTWYFNSSDPFQGADNATITITVTPFIPETYIPAVPVLLASTKGNFWINHSWLPGLTNITNNYNVSVNDLWTNGTIITYNNSTVPPHGWSNITVYAYNTSGPGSLSITPAYENIQLANNAPILSPTGDKSVTAGSLLSFNITSTDADSDPITYGTNASRGTLNTTTGEYTWQTTGSDAGTYTWYFNSSDPFQGTDNATITITVTQFVSGTYIPAVPVLLASIQGNFWINHSWLPGLTNITDSYNVSVNDLWTNGTIITYNNSTVTPHGWSNITVYAYNNSGSGSLSPTSVSENIQLANNAPILSLPSDKIVTAGSLLSFNITSIDADSDPITYGTNASRGTLNTATGEYTWQTTGSDAGTYTWYFNSSDPFQGTDNATITITVTPFIPETYIPAVPVLLAGTQGNFWINHSWLPGLTNITDSYNVSVNDLWTNGTIITYNNSTVTPHGWSNITVYAYNTSGTGSLNITPAYENIQLNNNAPVQSPTSDKIVTAGSLLSFNITSTDADIDPITYGTNASKGLLNTTTGEYTWQTTGSDAGTYTWYFNSSDPFQGTDNATISITVTPFIPETYIPAVPVLLASTKGNFWINHSWLPGSINITNNYNVSVNDLWTNGTIITYNNSTVPPHGWSNITVYAYNTSGTGSLSIIPAYENIQLNNNNPVQSAIGARTITAGDILGFTVSASDADSDPITHGTNASKGVLNGLTGVYSWTTTSSDVGTYTWYFNSSDNYGGIATETITVTVDPAALPIPPTPINLTYTQGNFWIEYAWEPGIGNITDSYNLTINSLTDTTSLTSLKNNVGPHGWSNITLWAYNNSGGLSQNSISRSMQVQNNDPVLVSIGNKNVVVVAGSTLQFTISASDADSDPMTYGTDAIYGNLDSGTGVYSWHTSAGDVGVYTWYFNSSDGYGGVDTETITVTVNEIPTYIPPEPTALFATQGNFWIEYTWGPGIGNITDSYNLTVNGLPYTTSLTSRNDTAGSHGWSNITVYAYNNSGSGSLSSSSISQNTQVTNNAPVQAPIGSKAVTAGNVLTFTVSATDADLDSLTYRTNAKGILNPTTGDYTWATNTSDVGTYTWSFNSSDNYGGIATETITVTVNAAAPVSQTVTLTANSAGNTGFSAMTTGENLYASNVSNS